MTKLTRRGVYEDASMINQFFRKRRIDANVTIDPNAPKRAPLFVVTPWAVVYSLDISPEQAFDKITAVTDDLAAHIKRQRTDTAMKAKTADVATIRKARVVVRFVANAMTIEIARWHVDTLLYDKIGWVPSEKFAALAGYAFDFLGRYPVEWILSDSDSANMLLSGMTGSGKTNALLQLVFSLCLTNSPDNLIIDVIDMKPSPDLMNIQHMAHVDRVAREPEDALHLLRLFARDMDERYRNPDVAYPRRMLVIDELMSISELDKSDRDDAQMLLGKIAGKCREAKMHMLACTLKPTNDILGSQLKSQMTIRFTGRMDTPEDARTATGIAGSGAHRLTGRGVFHWRSHEGMSTVQASFVGEADERIRQINQTWGYGCAIGQDEDAPPLPAASPARVENVSRLDDHFERTFDEDADAFNPNGLIEAKRIMFGKDKARVKGGTGAKQKAVVMEAVREWQERVSEGVEMGVQGVSEGVSEGVEMGVQTGDQTPENPALPERKSKDGFVFSSGVRSDSIHAAPAAA